MKWFHKISLFSKILVVVFCVQGLCVFCLAVYGVFAKEPPKKKIVVRTVVPPKPIARVSKPPPKKVLKKEPPKPKPIPKKEIKPKPALKKEPLKPKPKPVLKKEPPKPKPLPAKEVKVPAEKEEKVSLPLKKEPPTPKDTSSVEEPKEAVDYGEVLVHFFLNSLDLPDYGEVKMELEIDQAGKIVAISTLDSQSEPNELFLKKRLPELVCPCNNSLSLKGESFVCTIVFKNN